MKIVPINIFIYFFYPIFITSLFSYKQRPNVYNPTLSFYVL